MGERDELLVEPQPTCRAARVNQALVQTQIENEPPKCRARRQHGVGTELERETLAMESSDCAADARRALEDDDVSTAAGKVERARESRESRSDDDGSRSNHEWRIDVRARALKRELDDRRHPTMGESTTPLDVDSKVQAAESSLR